MNERIKVLFENALERPTAERDRYLEAACSDDPAVLREVRSLLEWDAKAEGLFEGAIEKLAQSMTPDSGVTVGAWRLFEEIGAGGMGTVFRAERAGGKVRQQAAIKFIRGGGESMRARFQREQQILARLEHPRIARLIDGGVTDEGLSFMAMEYFPGLPIDEYASRKSLGKVDRILLFQKVCEAVDFAHRNLIVHRDLKPSNVLVSDEGEPKLLDFGIARLLEPDDAATRLTVTGGLFFTPDYASPEQISGQPITTATDVYSLGVLLYELLTGKRPHRFSSLTPVEVVEAICHRPVPHPQLGNDLDQILLRALEKEPERRYDSARELSDDLQRFLDSRPVKARPKNARYRLGLFIRRHRIPAAAGAFALLSLFGGLGIAVWQARVAQHEAREANRRFEQVRSFARTVLFDLDPKIREVAGATEARELLVSTALQYLDSLHAENQEDAGLMREVAEAYERVGDALGAPARPNLGRRQDAIKSYGKAKALRESLPEPSTEDDVALASLCLKLAAITGEKTLVEDSVAAARSALGRRPGDPAVFSLAMRAQNALGNHYRNVSNGRAAIRHYDEALRLGEAWLAKSASAEASEEVANTLALKARAALLTGQPLATLAATNRITEIRQALLRTDPENAIHRRQLFKAQLLRGYALGHPEYFHLGRSREAAETFRAAIRIAEENVAADPKDALAQGDLGDAYWALAMTIANENPREAERLLNGSLQESLALVKRSPSTLSYLHNAAVSHIAIAVPLRAQARHGAAIAHLKEALRLQQEVADARPNQIGLRHNMIDTLVSLANIHLDLGDWRAATAPLAQALEIGTTVERGSSYLSKIPSMANLHETAGRFHQLTASAEASGWYRKAIANWNELEAEGISPAFVQPRKYAVQAALNRLDPAPAVSE